VRFGGRLPCIIPAFDTRSETFMEKSFGSPCRGIARETRVLQRGLHGPCPQAGRRHCQIVTGG
jgi:hypothetical protein